jgi:translation initiation factor 3 subunit M
LNLCSVFVDLFYLLFVVLIATKPLYDLLEIFQTGKLEDFYVFLSSSPANKTTLQTFGIEQETCIHHLRLLSLCSLAAEHEEIPYAAIASTLQIPMDQVEPWVISAVSSGLMSAKMDQLSHVVMVEQCVVRSFGMDEWKVLQTRLHGWKKNVGNILAALKQQQQLQTNSSTTNIVQQYVSTQHGVSSA